MPDQKRSKDASAAFREPRKPLTEHEEKRRALLKNMKRLRAERLAREENKEKNKK